MDEEIREKPLVTGDALAQLIGQMKPEGVQTIFGVISKEAEEFRLDTLKREILAQQCGVKDSEAESWQTAADVIKHFDMSELAKKHPEAPFEMQEAVVLRGNHAINEWDIGALEDSALTWHLEGQEVTCGLSPEETKKICDDWGVTSLVKELIG